MLCDQEQESWYHIWRCPHLLTRLIALQQATKQGFEDLLSVTVPNRSATFTSTWNALPCWSLPSTSSNAIVTFDYLIRGFIPFSLMALLMTVTSRKEATDITNNISHIAQSLFREGIWDYRCSKLAEWKFSKDITSEQKRTPPVRSA